MRASSSTRGEINVVLFVQVTSSARGFAIDGPTKRDCGARIANHAIVAVEEKLSAASVVEISSRHTVMSRPLLERVGGGAMRDFSTRRTHVLPRPLAKISNTHHFHRQRRLHSLPWTSASQAVTTAAGSFNHHGAIQRAHVHVLGGAEPTLHSDAALSRSDAITRELADDPRRGIEAV